MFDHYLFHNDIITSYLNNALRWGFKRHSLLVNLSFEQGHPHIFHVVSAYTTSKESTTRTQFLLHKVKDNLMMPSQARLNFVLMATCPSDNYLFLIIFILNINTPAPAPPPSVIEWCPD